MKGKINYLFKVKFFKEEEDDDEEITYVICARRQHRLFKT